MEASTGPASRRFALPMLETTMAMTDSDARFTPDWLSPPGDTIADLIEERDWTQGELAVRLGYSEKHVSQLINGKAALTEDAAIRLERVLGGPASFWLTREAQYRARCAQLEESDRLRHWVPWCDRLPVKELMDAGSIPKRRLTAQSRPQIVEDLLHLFGVASPEDWERQYARMELAFRRTREEQSDVGAITSWLRLGEIKAEKFD